MLKRWQKGFLILLALFLLWSFFKPAADLNGAELLPGHFWVERMPRDERDRVRQVIAIRQEGQAIGVFGNSSVYSLSMEMFEWSIDRDVLRVHMLQSDEHEKHRVKTWVCDEGEFNICMTLGKQKYFSRHEWHVDAMPATAPAWAQSEARRLLDAAR